QTDEVGDFEKRIIDTISDARPDIIIYTGDYVHVGRRSLYAEQAKRMSAVLQSMKWQPPFGSYAVLGDCDVKDLWRTVFEGTSVVLLDDQTVPLQLPGAKVKLIAMSPRQSRYAVRLKQPGAQELFIYIGHSPDYVRSLEQSKVTFLA